MTKIILITLLLLQFSLSLALLFHSLASLNQDQLSDVSLDQLRAQNGLKEAVFINAGYGVQNRVVGHGVPFFQDLNPVPRMFSFSSFNSLNKGYLRLSQNPSTGDGGTCFGDSGGPNFLSVNRQQLIVSITISGDSVCRSTNVDYRLDTISAQAFLASVNAAFGTSIPISC